MKGAIRERARQLGFDECQFTTAAPPLSAGDFQHWLTLGFHGEMGWLERNASKRVDPGQVLLGAKTVVMLGSSYYLAQHTPTNHTHSPHGKIARYAQFNDYHHVLAKALKGLSEFIVNIGPADTRCLWYVDTGPILERDLAQRSGLGFAGKHTNLVSRRFGNWLFLAEILTTAEIEPDAPQKNLCGSCARCISACPTGAITAPYQLDARRCISYLTIELKGAIPEELRPAIGNRIYGCDDCLAACPWNRFAREGRIMKPHAREDLLMPDLLQLLELDEPTFRQQFQGTPILRTKRRGLLRNVCVALGNIGDDRALAALTKASADPEPLIAEHATWAIRQISQRRESARARLSTPCQTNS